MIQFIGVDGEGSGDRLTLLAASDGTGKIQHYVENYTQDGLSTEDCVQFLWWLKRRYPKYKFIGFSFTYDVNMILYPLLCRRKPMVKRLHERKYVRVQLNSITKLAVRFYPGKFVVFTELDQNGNATGTNIQIEDTFGFYQQAFVKALTTWEMSDNVALERIAEGKLHRADLV